MPRARPSNAAAAADAPSSSLRYAREIIQLEAQALASVAQRLDDAFCARGRNAATSAAAA